MTERMQEAYDELGSGPGSPLLEKSRALVEALDRGDPDAVTAAWKDLENLVDKIDAARAELRRFLSRNV